jgi:hypothetical protein
MDKHHNKSIEDVFGALKKFDHKAPEGSCFTCRTDFNATVSLAISKVRDNFDGLCYDCLDEDQYVSQILQDVAMSANSNQEE